MAAAGRPVIESREFEENLEYPSDYFHCKTWIWHNSPERTTFQDFQRDFLEYLAGRHPMTVWNATVTSNAIESLVCPRMPVFKAASDSEMLVVSRVWFPLFGNDTIPRKSSIVEHETRQDDMVEDVFIDDDDRPLKRFGLLKIDHVVRPDQALRIARLLMCDEMTALEWRVVGRQVEFERVQAAYNKLDRDLGSLMHSSDDPGVVQKVRDTVEQLAVASQVSLPVLAEGAGYSPRLVADACHASVWGRPHLSVWKPDSVVVGPWFSSMIPKRYLRLDTIKYLFRKVPDGTQEEALDDQSHLLLMFDHSMAPPIEKFKIVVVNRHQFQSQLQAPQFQMTGVQGRRS